MAPLGALSQAWVSAEASLPLGWRISGLWRFGDRWIALSEAPAFDDYLSGSGQTADHALRRMADHRSLTNPYPPDPGDGSGHRGSHLVLRGHRGAAGLELHNGSVSVEEVAVRSANRSTSFLVMRAISSSDSRYDDYEGPNVTVELALDGLVATAILPAYAMPVREMVALFREIDRDWRGWPGTKTTGDPESAWPLTVAAEHDGKGHVSITLSLSDGWPLAHNWSTQVTVQVDVGTTADIAAAIEQWASRVWPAGWSSGALVR